MACNNAWANHRLIAACSRLSQADFVAPRTSFFPTLKATLNHNLTVDWYYVDALERALKGSPPNRDVTVNTRPELACHAAHSHRRWLRCHRTIVAAHEMSDSTAAKIRN